MTDQAESPSIFDNLPGDLMMWILIVSELLVFGAGLAAFLAVRITDPLGFAEAQDHLHRTGAGVNTVVLVTSGYLAARAVQAIEAGRILFARLNLAAAAALGTVFLLIKTAEYAEIQGMVAKLREKSRYQTESNEPTRVITVRLPKSLHESLKAESHQRRTSMNQLCISKLLQIIDQELVPSD